MPNNPHQAQNIPGGCGCGGNWCEKKWAAHDAWVYPQWDEQHRFNSFVRKQLALLMSRYWFALGLATVGSFFGAALATYLVQRLLGGS